MMGKQPLVSIIAVTYNSSKTILETLESIYSQTFQDIELIVTDDFSKDNTPEICKKWLQDKGERFLSYQVIFSEKNTGIPSNCNRGIRSAQGAWIKLIAGDDILDSRAIENMLNYLSCHGDCQILSSKIQAFDTFFRKENFIQHLNSTNLHFYSDSSSAIEQYLTLAERNPIDATGIIFSKKLWEISGGFDEQYRNIEDWPFWIKITSKGVKINFLDELTAFYRMTSKSEGKTKAPKNLHQFEKSYYAFQNIPSINLLTQKDCKNLLKLMKAYIFRKNKKFGRKFMVTLQVFKLIFLYNFDIKKIKS